MLQMSNLYRVQLILGKAKEQDMHAECAILYGKVRCVSLQSVNRTLGHQIYGGPRSLSHDFKIWPISFQGSGPSRPILFSCEKISL